jgi:hypothetical protein
MKAVQINIPRTKYVAPLKHGFLVCQGKYPRDVIKRYDRNIEYISSSSNRN